MNISDSNLKKIVWGVTILIPLVVTLLAVIPGLELSPEAKEAMYAYLNSMLLSTVHL